VVEGKEDASYLSNYIASEIVVVNGYELDPKTIAYLKGKKVIALLDPDEAGKAIRKKLNTIISDIINVEIDINKCNRGKKNGVAECQIDELIGKLQAFSVKNHGIPQNIAISDLYNLGIIENNELRQYVTDKLNLCRCNNKQLLKRLNLNQVQLDLLKNIVEEYHGN
jgi:ribonuclease M5